MRIFPPPIEIGETEGFAPEKDIFRRAEFGIGLADLVMRIEDPLVMALDGPWGSGKTIFVKMWAGLLRQRGHPVIYFDAFANDHIDDAFVAIAGEVVSLSKAKKKEKTSAHKRFLSKAGTAGRALLRSGAKIGVKAATLGALDAADFQNLKSVASDIASEASTKSDEYIKTLLTRQEAEKNSIAEFGQALTELATVLSDAGTNEAATNSLPLIFILDELDRCKPPFALELIEKIKHVFSVRGVHFVLVTHLPQLENSVRYSYGEDIDARTYLQKFYNLIVHLPADEKHRHNSAFQKFVAYLGKHSPQDRQAYELLEKVARAKSLSFRALERIAGYMSLALAFTSSERTRFFRPSPILAGLCVLKVTEPELFRKAKSGSLQLSETLEALGYENWERPDREEWAIRWWRFALEEQINEADFNNFIPWEFSIDDRKDIVPIVANSVIDRMKFPEN